MKIGLLFLGCAALFFIVNVSDIKCQTPAPVTGNGATVGEQFFEMRKRANELNRVRTELNKPGERAPEASFPKIKKDFERLQIINTEKLQKQSVGNKLDLKSIADAAEDINKHAVKLRNILFPETATGKKGIEQPTGLTISDYQKLIIALDNSIYHFVSSPIFQNTKLVKPEDSEDAQKELNRIIILSSILESCAERAK